MTESINQTEIVGAYDLIKNSIRKTPVVESRTGDFGLRFGLNLKLESLQYAGSFKTRGAFNNLLNSQDNNNEVTAASGGNHGAAVAYAAGSLGVKSTIFVPETSSTVKIDRIRTYGANVNIEGSRYADAAELCESFQKKTGAKNIHPYDTKDTIVGQGTIGLEWEEQTPDLDLVLIAVGGGGLISGISSWFGNRVKVIGVEPKGSSALYTAIQNGKPTNVEVNSVAADSLGAKRIGNLPFQIACESVDEVVLVDDSDILRAQALLWREMQIAAEPGGATALAAIISGAYQPEPEQKVGVLVCGGNVNLNNLSEIATGNQEN